MKFLIFTFVFLMYINLAYAQGGWGEGDYGAGGWGNTGQSPPPTTNVNPGGSTPPVRFVSANITDTTILAPTVDDDPSLLDTLLDFFKNFLGIGTSDSSDTTVNVPSQPFTINVPGLPSFGIANSGLVMGIFVLIAVVVIIGLIFLGVITYGMITRK